MATTEGADETIAAMGSTGAERSTALGLATVAASGDYNDLINTPAGAAVTGATGAIVSRSTSQTVDNTTDTPVQFTAELLDQDGYFDSEANTRLTAPEDGWYDVTAGVNWDTNVNGARFMHIKVNNTEFTATQSAGAGVGDLRQNTSGKYFLTAGDYVELVIFQTSGSQRTIDEAKMVMLRIP